MNLFHRLFDRKEKKPASQEAGGTRKEAQPDVYSGMRVEVTDQEGKLLFVAKLQGLRGDKAELYQYSETELSPEEEAIPVHIRGYNDHTRKAIYMEAAISPVSKHTWKVEGLTVSRAANDRAFFRLNTDLPATAVTFSGLEMGEKPCRMLNISVGGACIRSEFQYYEGDKFLLKVKLIEDRPESVMYCQVLRIVERENGFPEYGCQFLELTEEDQERIIQNIFTAQRQKRGNS